MTLKRHFLWVVLMLATLTVSAAQKQRTVYMYGFAASFNDSTVYFTDIIQVDSAYVDDKTGFLYSRSDYSYQLRDFLAAQGVENMTCITSFALKRKDAEKKFTALRKRYITSGRYDVNYLGADKFGFTAIQASSDETADKPQPEKQKKPKGQRPDGQGGPGGGPGGPGGGMGGPGGMSGMGGGQPPMH